MVIAVLLGCISMIAPAEAQLNTQHIKGTVGLKSGSQAPPGVYFIAPLFYVYKADEVKRSSLRSADAERTDCASTSVEPRATAPRAAPPLASFRNVRRSG